VGVFGIYILKKVSEKSLLRSVRQTGLTKTEHQRDFQFFDTIFMRRKAADFDVKAHLSCSIFGRF